MPTRVAMNQKKTRFTKPNVADVMSARIRLVLIVKTESLNDERYTVPMLLLTQKLQWKSPFEGSGSGSLCRSSP